MSQGTVHSLFGASAAPNGASAASGAPSTPAPAFTFKRGDQVELAEATLAVLETSELAYDEGHFWRYAPDTGIWERLPPEVVMTTAASFAGAPVMSGASVKPLRLANSAIIGATEIMRASLLAKPGRRKFADGVAGVVFANGFVQVLNGVMVLQQHAPDHLARHAHPFDFVSGAPHPLLDQFFDEIFADATPSDRAERVALIQEFDGTCLIGEAPKHQRALVLYGEGANGKSEALKIVRATVPHGGVVSLPPQQWSERFQIARLVGVLANFVDEIPERDITGGEVFKSVVTGEPVHCERKHEQPFEFQSKAGHIFSANTLPGTVDQSHGFWRRLMVCPFTLDMEKARSHRPNAAQAVIAAELPAIVAWALEGAARVQRQGKYTVPSSSSKLMEVWRRDVDPVRSFASSVCIANPLAATTPAEMYRGYVAWTERNGFAQMSSTKFMKRLNGAGVKSTHTSTGNVYRWRLTP